MGQEPKQPAEERHQVKEELPGDSPESPRQEVHSLGVWCKPLQDFLDGDRGAGEAMRFLRELITELDSPLSGHLSHMGELEQDLPAEETPLATEPPLLLPVRVSAVRKFLDGKDETMVSWVVALVEVLSYYATLGRVKLGPATLTAAQELMVTRLEESVNCFLAKGGELPAFAQAKADLATAKFDYGGEPVQYMEELLASKVIPCWPAIGEAAVQDAVRKWLEAPQECLLPQAAWPDHPPKSRVRASDEEWEDCRCWCGARHDASHPQ